MNPTCQHRIRIPETKQRKGWPRLEDILDPAEPYAREDKSGSR